MRYSSCSSYAGNMNDTGCRLMVPCNRWFEYDYFLRASTMKKDLTLRGQCNGKVVLIYRKSEKYSAPAGIEPRTYQFTMFLFVFNWSCKSSHKSKWNKLINITTYYRMHAITTSHFCVIYFQNTQVVNMSKFIKGSCHHRILYSWPRLPLAIGHVGNQIRTTLCHCNAQIHRELCESL